MRQLKKIIFVLLSMFMMQVAFAATSPMDMAQGTSDQMLAALAQNKASLKSNPQVVYRIVRSILLPHVDINGMSRSVVGRGWNKATPSQQKAFTQQFTTLLVRTYSAAFASFSNQTVKFLPLRGDVSGQSRVQIDSRILQPDGPAISVSYRLILEGDEWKVYDFSVDGVSMIQSFRSQFSQQLNQGGMDALIAQLTRHNNSPNAQ